LTCPVCGCVFCPALNVPDTHPQVYCQGNGCAKIAARRRYQARVRERERAAAKLAAAAARFEKQKAACLRKIAYGSQRQADRHIPAMRLKGYPVDHSNDCPVCPWWHHTTRPDRNQKTFEGAGLVLELRAAG
jgi:hypothetical protein